MKKLVILGCAAALAGAAVAAANDVLVTFSTPGPDTYADGKAVLDGETYALCWSRDFSQFKVLANGTAEGGSIVLKAPVAKGGRCPTIVFEVDAGYAARNFAGGEWAVYLLDTRRFGKDGAVSLANGVVNSVGQVGAAVTVGSGTVASLTGAKAAAGTDTALLGGEPTPEITGIRVYEGNVYVTVRGTVPHLAYSLSSGATPDKVETKAGDPLSGDANDEITLVAPAKDGAGFFKVGRK